MQQRSKFIQRTSALALAAVLALGMGVQAAGPGASKVDDRREDLTMFYETLKDSHPDLFANTPEETFLARKAELTEHLDSASDVEFLFGLQSLAALVGDSHTSVQVADSVVDQLNAYPMVLSWRDGHWYLTTVPAEEQDLLGAEVTAIGGRSMAEVVKTFGRVLSADNPVKLRRQYRQVCNVADYYAYLGLAKAGEPLALTLADGKTVSIAPMPYLSLGEAEIVQLGAEVPQPATARQKCNYCALPLSGQVYYIQYNVCQEDPALPMEDFAAQVQADLEAGGYSRVLVDLRNNGGGSDGVIWPLLSVLRQEMDDGTEVVGLIGEATFSSAIINAVELQEMGIPLVGEPASGSVDHFGSVSGFSLPNSGIQIGVSSKYIDLGTLLDADAGRGVESLEPDIAVPQTMADTLAGRDTAVEWLLAHPETLEQREYPDAPLTRGRFVGLLYAAAGSPAAAAEAGFQDLLGIEWFLPAVNWAAETGVTGGTAEGAFAAARHLTWQEAAVFLVRTVEALGLEPEAVRTAPLPDALAEGAWDQTALELAWEWGLLPEDAGSAAEIARVQGGAMADAFAALLYPHESSDQKQPPDAAASGGCLNLSDGGVPLFSDGLSSRRTSRQRKGPRDNSRGPLIWYMLTRCTWPSASAGADSDPWQLSRCAGTARRRGRGTRGSDGCTGPRSSGTPDSRQPAPWSPA